MRSHTASRIGLIGDVHGEPERLAAAIATFDAGGVDRIICTGDIVDGRGSSDACVTILRGRAIATVRGNHERWLLEGQSFSKEVVSAETRSWLASLPRLVRVDTTLGTLVLCHGVGLEDMAFFPANSIDISKHTAAAMTLVSQHARIVVAGHTHMRDVRAVSVSKATFWWINPGSLADDRGAGFAMLDCNASVVTFWNLVGATPVLAGRVPLPGLSGSV